MQAKRSWVAVALGLVGLATPTTASAATTIGPNPLPQRTGVVGAARTFTNSVVPGVELASPIDGVVVRWRVRRGSGGGGMTADTITLRVLRPTGVVSQFTAVGTSEPHMVPGGAVDPVDVYEYPTRLPIAAGDRIGLGTTAQTATYRTMTNASYLERDPPLADGATATFDPGTFPNLYVLVNADVEPDCDSDGFGDETQDADTSSCIADTAAPNTTITKGPKDKTKRKRATFEFTGTDARAIASFQCKLDKGAFAPCTSPHTVKVKRGKHTFQVHAIDEAGNVSSPATDDWKVKKKRKK
jgi:hypothetical protein